MDNYTLPHSIDTEISIIAELLCDGSTRNEYMGLIHVEDFYMYEARTIFNAIQKINVTGKNIDALTVITQLKNENNIEKIGGSSYILDLMNNNIAHYNFMQHLDTLKEYSKRRSLINISQSIIQKAYNPEEQIKTTLDRASRSLMDISMDNHNSELQPVGLIVGDQLEALKERMKNKGSNAVTGIPTGIEALTQAINGYNNSDYVLLAGRPSMGKTTLALNNADYIATELKKNVAFFSLEMDNNDLVNRMLASRSNTPLNAIRKGVISGYQYEVIQKCGLDMDDGGLFLYEDACSMADIRSLAIRMKTKVGLDIIFIDYIDFIMPSKNLHDKNKEISEISRSLKRLAKELKIPIVVLAQLNRTLEKRPDKRPILSDLRDSGSLEQDADIVMMLYRDSYYNTESQEKGKTELLIRKQRNGETGTIELGFYNNLTKFVDYDEYVHSKNGR